LPLGTAVAIEFLGPIAVSAITISSARGLVWPLAAVIGVFLLTSPWRGGTDTLGLAWAVVAAIAWAGYILVAERVGSEALGIEILAVALAISAATLAPWGASAALSAITPVTLGFVGVLALLMPLYAYAAEILALQRMATTSFATLTAIEPAIATLVGVMQLHQYPTPWQAIGMGCVVVAGVGASRTSQRP
jgi:inner membrane transporter RhtA